MLVLDGMQVSLDGFALEGDLALSAGKKVAVIGPSGAGKSTLLDVIAGFRKPEAGRIIWHGQDLTDSDPRDRPVAMLFQDQNLFPHLTVDRNLGLALRPDGRGLNSGQKAAVGRALETMGLAGLGGRKPAALSGGQQARAALARVLLQERPILLLDEPFAALGPALRREMLDVVGDVAVATGALVLLVSHDPADAKAFADEVVFVDAGKAHPPQDTADLFENPPEAVRAYLGEV